jgi:hypothetical protein
MVTRSCVLPEFRIGYLGPLKTSLGHGNTAAGIRHEIVIS